MSSSEDRDGFNTNPLPSPQRSPSMSRTMRIPSKSKSRTCLDDALFEAKPDMKRSKSDENIKSAMNDLTLVSPHSLETKSPVTPSVNKVKNPLIRLFLPRRRSDDIMHSSTTDLSTGTKSLKKSAPSKIGKKSKQKFEEKLADFFLDLEHEEVSTDDKTTTLLFSLFREIDKLDTWSSKKEQKSIQWDDISRKDFDHHHKGIFDTRCRTEGYQFEFGSNAASNGDNLIEESEKGIQFYKDHFFGKDHSNFVSDGEDDKLIGPVCISLEEPDGSTEDKKALLRTKKGNERFLIPSQHCNSTKDMIKYIRNSNYLGDLKLTEVANQDFHAKLLEFENQLIVTRYKFGLLYVKEGQTDENDMFSNSEMSSDLQEFMEFLGEKIELKGWTGYRGGLNVKEGVTGSHSVFTRFRNEFDIMFHVSTLLPFQKSDIQRVERKRHLGNDVVLIVFKEGNTPFDPTCIKSQFNHVFIVIQVDKRTSKYSNSTHYRVAISCKPGVVPFGPYLPNPAVFEKNDQFREFILTKLINAERAAMKAPDFKGKLVRTCKDLLYDMAIEWSSKAKRGKKASISFLKALDQITHSKQHDTSIEVSTDDDTYVDFSDMSDQEMESEPVFHSEVDHQTTEFKWEISPEQKIEFQKEFDQIVENDKLMTGLQAATLFISTGLSKLELTKIWALSDIDADRHLDLHEFGVARFLISARMKGYEIPSILPESLDKPGQIKWNLTPNQKAEYRRQFDRADKDGDGIISGTEAAHLFLPMGLPTNELAKIWAIADINKDRKMHFNEYVVANLLVKARLAGDPIPATLPGRLIRLMEDLDSIQDPLPIDLSPKMILKDGPKPPKQQTKVTKSFIIGTLEEADRKGWKIGMKNQRLSASMSLLPVANRKNSVNLELLEPKKCRVNISMIAIFGKEKELYSYLAEEAVKQNGGVKVEVFQDVKDARQFHICAKFPTREDYKEWEKVLKTDVFQKLVQETPNTVSLKKVKNQPNKKNETIGN
eukprot:TRINITY_DN779_c0_g1_i12.p1 TRINITY_DN779_c0_g1~~TRINITY_DN779_c0_g1_i12.p1  ORF type:complete len:994 (+),score=254.51 TRINITY_DN779_c0_g1_i12:1213-4194(+)